MRFLRFRLDCNIIGPVCNIIGLDCNTIHLNVVTVGLNVVIVIAGPRFQAWWSVVAGCRHGLGVFVFGVRKGLGW
jgi:hypothetical protein